MAVDNGVRLIVFCFVTEIIVYNYLWNWYLNILDTPKFVWETVRTQRWPTMTTRAMSRHTTYSMIWMWTVWKWMWSKVCASVAEKMWVFTWPVFIVRDTVQTIIRLYCISVSELPLSNVRLIAEFPRTYVLPVLRIIFSWIMYSFCVCL